MFHLRYHCTQNQATLDSSPYTTYFTAVAGGRIRVHRWGRGARLLVCLHGYGDTGERFSALAEALGAAFTVVAPDLPWHGATDWHKASFDAWDVQEMVEGLLSLESKADGILLGHSWGARLVMASLPLLRERVSAAYLVAPGGFDPASRWAGEKLPLWMRNPLIESVEKHTRRWLGFAEWYVGMGWASASALRFFQSNLEAPERRARLMAVWKNLHAFRLRKAPLQSLPMPKSFVVGGRDMLVSPHAVRRFAHGLPNTRFLILPDCGHWPDGASLAKIIL